VHVAALGGATFTAVGSAVGSCDADAVIASVGGTPYVACRASGGVGIEVYSWNGSAWGQVGAAISNASTAYGAGLAEVGGTPYVAFATQSGQVEVESFAGGNWTQVGATLLGMAGGSPETPALLSDGANPVLAWTESDTVAGSQQEDVFAEQLQGASWTALNSGSPVNVSSSGAPQASLDGLAMVGPTPYLSLDEFATTGASRGYALALAGSSFQATGGPIVTNTLGYLPQVALGTLAGAPLAVTADQDASGNVSLNASTLSSGAWSALGTPLGVPPLPSTNGTPYGGAALASDQAGTPYVFFRQETNDGQDGAQEGLFAEAYTAAGVNPNAPPTTSSTPPPPTTQTLTASPTAAAGASLPAAFVELTASPRLTRRGKAATLGSGLTVTCPTTSGSKACTGSATIQLKVEHAPEASALTLTDSFSVTTGTTRTLTITIPAAKLKLLRKHGQKISGTLKITITGPNGQPTSISEPLSAHLP
jgi:hypothetical protein